MQRTIRRRRREAKTDYKARFAMLKSGRPRLVIRKTNKHIIAQIVQSDIAQDKVLLGVSSKDLISKGWPKDKSGSLKSLVASYLTGYLIGKLAKAKFSDVIVDLGMQRNIHGSRVYAVIKGAVDAGLKLSHNPEAFPSQERLNSNEKTSNLINRIKEKM